MVTIGTIIDSTTSSITVPMIIEEKISFHIISYIEIPTGAKARIMKMALSTVWPMRVEKEARIKKETLLSCSLLLFILLMMCTFTKPPTQKAIMELTMVLGPLENTRAKALFCSSYSARDGMNTISLPITRRTKVMTAAKVITFMLSFSPHTSTMTLEMRNTIQLMVWPPSENVTPVPQERDFMQNTFIARVTAA